MTKKPQDLETRTKLSFISFDTEVSILGKMRDYSIWDEFMSQIVMHPKRYDGLRLSKKKEYYINKKDFDFMMRNTTAYRLIDGNKKEFNISKEFEKLEPVGFILYEELNSKGAYDIIKEISEAYIKEKNKMSFTKENKRRTAIRTTIVLIKDINDMPLEFFEKIEEAVKSGKYELPENILFVREYSTKLKKEPKNYLVVQ